jgi:CheY-like chemotaxis protein
MTERGDRETTRRVRILLVDDNAEVRESLALLLSLTGYEVLESSDGADALETIGREPPDLLITDLRMPGMDGLELIRQVRGSPAPVGTTPIIALSVRGPGELEEAREAGADSCVDKLSDFELVLEAIRGLAGR